MPNQSGPTTSAGKAASSRNAMRHGLTNLHPVVTEDDRPEYEALRELERLQRLQLLNDVHFGEEHAVSALHDLQLYQRFAKQNGLPPQPVLESAQNPQPLSNQQSAKRNPAPAPAVGRNSPCPCGSTKKYKRCCGVNAPPILHAA